MESETEGRKIWRKMLAVGTLAALVWSPVAWAGPMLMEERVDPAGDLPADPIPPGQVSASESQAVFLHHLQDAIEHQNSSFNADPVAPAADPISAMPLPVEQVQELPPPSEPPPAPKGTKIKVAVVDDFKPRQGGKRESHGAVVAKNVRRGAQGDPNVEVWEYQAFDSIGLFDLDLKSFKSQFKQNFELLKETIWKAIQEGARVLNFSWGHFSETLEDSLKSVIDEVLKRTEVFIVASTGNEGKDGQILVPADWPGVHAVAAKVENKIASYANFSNSVKLAVDERFFEPSTSGTSAASGFMAGFFGRQLSIKPRMTAGEMVKTAQEAGHGRPTGGRVEIPKAPASEKEMPRAADPEKVQEVRALIEKGLLIQEARRLAAERIIQRIEVLIARKTLGWNDPKILRTLERARKIVDDSVKRKGQLQGYLKNEGELANLIARRQELPSGEWRREKRMLEAKANELKNKWKKMVSLGDKVFSPEEQDFAEIDYLDAAWLLFWFQLSNEPSMP